MSQVIDWNVTDPSAAPGGGIAVDSQAQLESLVADLERSVAEVHKTAAQALISAGDYKRALLHAEAAAVFGPEDPEVWNTLGWLRYLEGDDQGAVQAFDRGLAVSPGQGDLLYNKGMVFYGAGRKDEAEVLWEDALRAGCRTAELFNNLGVVRFAKGRVAEAADLFRKALEMEPEYAEAKENLAACGAAPAPGPAW